MSITGLVLSLALTPAMPAQTPLTEAGVAAFEACVAQSADGSGCGPTYAADVALYRGCVEAVPVPSPHAGNPTGSAAWAAFDVCSRELLPCWHESYPTGTGGLVIRACASRQEAAMLALEAEWMARAREIAPADVYAELEAHKTGSDRTIRAEGAAEANPVMASGARLGTRGAWMRGLRIFVVAWENGTPVRLTPAR